MTLAEFDARHHAARRAFIAAALLAANGNRTHAARALGVFRPSLVRVVRKYDLAPAAGRGEKRAVAPERSEAS